MSHICSQLLGTLDHWSTSLCMENNSNLGDDDERVGEKKKKGDVTILLSCVSFLDRHRGGSGKKKKKKKRRIMAHADDHSTQIRRVITHNS